MSITTRIVTSMALFLPFFACNCCPHGAETLMEIRHGHVRQDLPDEWWEEAGMVGFVPARAAYRPNPSPYPVGRVFEIPIADVEPFERKLSHGIFNDSSLFGTARERVVSLLRGFREDAAIPPVHVVRLGPAAPIVSS